MEGVPERIYVQQRVLRELLVGRQRVPCAVLGHGAAVADHQLCAGGLRACQQLFHKVGRYRVVAVHHRQPGGRGGLHPGVARAGRAGPGLGRVQNADAWVFFCPGIAHFRAAVRAFVVDEQQLKVRERLRKDALDAGVEGRLGLVDRDDDADGGRHALPSAGASSTPGRWIRLPMKSFALSGCQREIPLSVVKVISPNLMLPSLSEYRSTRTAV